jgi:hypothetical protein
VQRLGTAATYVTARRAIKTSAADCRVRGGEYTESGEATYASLMRVWMPLAKSGDPEAQTNLGEIFEKGVGGPPQYDLAVQWYRLAAEGGYARAQVNLGSLYERGVGVPRDTTQAMSWYRRASGLNSPLSGVPTEEVNRLRVERDSLAQQLSAEKRRREELETELNSVKQRLGGERSSLQQQQQRLDEARRELATRSEVLQQQSSLLAHATGANADASGKLAQMQRALEEQRAIVAERDTQLQRMRASVRDLEARSDTLQQQLANTQQQGATQLAAARQEASSARQELALVNERLRKTTDDLNARLAQIAEQGAAVEHLRQQLNEQQPTKATTPNANQVQLEAQLRQRETELAESRRQLAALNAAVAQLDAQSKSTQRALQSSTPSTSVSRVPSGVSFGKYYALVIGNNNYQFIPRLRTAAGDARAIAEVLQNHYGFETTLLLEANRYQLLSALNKLREVLTSDDNLLIYYAGHGTVDPDSDRGYWLPVDAEADSTANWIPSYQITDFLKAIPAKQIMLVADSCYSGMLTRYAITRLDAGITDEERLRWYQTMSKKHARVVLTSGGNQPVLDGGAGDHSVFAGALIHILQENQDVLEGQRLAQEVTKRVAVSVAAARIDQVPTYAPLGFAGHEAGDFFFVPK